MNFQASGAEQMETALLSAAGKAEVSVDFLGWDACDPWAVATPPHQGRNLRICPRLCPESVTHLHLLARQWQPPHSPLTR